MDNLAQGSSVIVETFTWGELGGYTDGRKYSSGYNVLGV